MRYFKDLCATVCKKCFFPSCQLLSVFFGITCSFICSILNLRNMKLFFYGDISIMYSLIECLLLRHQKENEINDK